MGQQFWPWGRSRLNSFERRLLHFFLKSTRPFVEKLGAKRKAERADDSASKIRFLEMETRWLGAIA
jgi:hypothetical protein